MSKIAVCIISGGMDSALSATIAKEEGYEIVALHFNYGQRTEDRELKAFRDITNRLDVIDSYEIDLDFFKQIGASALTDSSIDVPTDGIEEGVPPTYVPFRNGIFLSIASAIAEKHNASALYIGVVEEDSSGYPDCRDSYIKAMQEAIGLGTKDETKIEIKMPLVALKKSEIVSMSISLGVPLELTWSCYQSSNIACGVCDSCRLRLRGFELAGKVDPIEYVQSYPNFPKDCKSMLCRHLTPQIFDRYRDSKTKYGYTLDRAIRSGVENIDSGIGVYAGDEESYSLFSALFDPIIEEYHHFSPTDSHISDLNPTHLSIPKDTNLDRYIISTRIRVARNIKGYPLGTAIDREGRLRLERDIVSALKSLDGELEGEYYSLLGMSREVQSRLIEEHFLFKEGDRFLQSAGLNRDWPEGRGIYHNRDKRFLVWVNEEDQMRIISMQSGGDIGGVFSRLSRAIEKLQEKLEFSYSDHLGYITSCPTNLGTAMRGSVHIKLPYLSKDMTKFKSITDKYHLQIRGIDGEHSQSVGGVYDISNSRRLGITEVEAIEEMYRGVVALIEAEEELLR